MSTTVTTNSPEYDSKGVWRDQDLFQEWKTVDESGVEATAVAAGAAIDKSMFPHVSYQVAIVSGANVARIFQIQVSNDGVKWELIAASATAAGGEILYSFYSAAKWIRWAVTTGELSSSINDVLFHLMRR